MNAAEFWAARDAWTAATIARQAAAPKTKRRRPLLLEQQRKWTINASKYLASRPKILAASVAPPDLRSPCWRSWMPCLAPWLSASTMG